MPLARSSHGEPCFHEAVAAIFARPECQPSGLLSRGNRAKMRWGGIVPQGRCAFRSTRWEGAQIRPDFALSALLVPKWHTGLLQPCLIPRFLDRPWPLPSAVVLPWQQGSSLGGVPGGWPTLEGSLQAWNGPSRWPLQRPSIPPKTARNQGFACKLLKKRHLATPSAELRDLTQEARFP